MLRNKQGKKGAMIFKIDLEKAYDRLECDFIRSTLDYMGLPKKMIEKIIECITISSFHLLWNGELIEAVRLTLGIFQGEPISSYIYVLYLERLSHCIYTEVEGRH